MVWTIKVPVEIWMQYMKKYKVVGIRNFVDEDDFIYVMKLLESTGYTFLYPVDHIISKIDWRTARIFSSPTNQQQLFVVDGDDIGYEVDKEFDMKNYF